MLIPVYKTENRFWFVTDGFIRFLWLLLSGDLICDCLQHSEHILGFHNLTN